MVKSAPTRVTKKDQQSDSALLTLEQARRLAVATLTDVNIADS